MTRWSRGKPRTGPDLAAHDRRPSLEGPAIHEERVDLMTTPKKQTGHQLWLFSRFRGSFMPVLAAEGTVRQR
jgi:hypothetical protein